MARKKEEVTLDNIGLNSHDFKHLETTKDIEIELKSDRGYPLRPNAAHKWTAKVATRGTGKDSYVGDYNVAVTGGKLIVDSAEFTKLAPGEYELELWEQWDGETSIYPSPSQRVPFTINRNITDMSGEVVKQTTIQDIVNSAVEHVGLNLEVENTGSGTVSSRYEDGKIKLTFALPQGPQGKQGIQGPPGPAPRIDTATGNWVTDRDTGIKAQGPKGDPGQRGVPGQDGISPTLSIGQVQTLASGSAASASFTQVGAGSYALNLALPAGLKGNRGEQGLQGAPGLPGAPGTPGRKGDPGKDGEQGIQGLPGKDGVSPQIKIGEVTTLPAGQNATASVVAGENGVFTISLGVPAGQKGETGGDNRIIEPNLTIGTITTLEPGAQATASLVKASDSSYVVNLGIPTGPQGQQGNPGSDGQKGDPGSDGKPGSAGADGVTPHIDPTTGNWFTNRDTGVKAQGPRGLKGEQGDPGDKGDPGVQGIPGDPGRPGDPGKDGAPGANGHDGVTPHIDDTTGHWMIGATDTNVKAQGPQGEPGTSGAPGTPGQNGADGITPHIDADTGRWFVGSSDTGVKAQGPQGLQGNNGGLDTAQVQAIQSSLAASSSAASQAQTMASQAQATASAALPAARFTWDSLSGKPSLAKQTDVDSLASAVGTNAEIANGEIAALNQKIGLVGKAVAEGGQAGQDGQNGITPHIDGTTGNWCLGTTDTGVHAQGPQGDPGDSGAPGLTPHIDPYSGHWMLGTTDTGVTARGEAASAPAIDDSAYKEPGSGLVAKIINEADDRGINVRHFGIVGDGSTDNTTALRALATWADQQPGKQIIFFPPGTYVWSGSVQFNEQVELTGTEDTWLQYTGTGSALILGKDGITDADHLDYRSFTVHNLGFIGGDNADYLIHFNNFVTQSRVSYCRFHNAGGLNHTQGQYCIYFNRDAWDGRVEHCQFDAAPGQGQRQFVSMEEYGNSRIMVTNNLVTSLTGFGTAVYLNGANCMITHNKIEGFQCNVRLGKSADHSIVAFNYFEKNGRSMASACVEVGNFNATDSAAPKYLYIANNYANLHNVAGLMYSTLIGPSGPKSLIRDTLLSNNTINGGNWSADTPAFGYLVRENNLPGQTGNHISGYYLSIGIQALMDTSTTDGSANQREAWTMDDDRATSGQNGKTPVRGVDYWTDSDIATIKGYVDDAILNGKW